MPENDLSCLIGKRQNFFL